MKRILILFLLLGMTLSMCVFADSAETLTVSVSGKTEGYAVGDVVTVTVTAPDPSKLYYLCVTPTYNKSVFSMTAENGNVFADMGADTNLTFDGIASSRGNTVATLKFKVLSNTVGTYSFGLTVREAYSESETPVSCTVSGNASVSVGTSTKATISTESKSASTGETVTVSVSIRNNPGMMFLSVTPVYDKNALTLESVNNGTVFPTEPTRDVNYTWDESANVTGNGTLFTYTFKVKEKAAAGSYSVGVSLRECYNASEQSVTLAVENGTMTVKSGLAGDVNGDGSRSTNDLVVLAKYLCGLQDVPKYPDVNNDGVHDLLDLVRLMKLLAK